MHLLVNIIEILRNAWYLQYQDLHHYVSANLQSVAGHNSRNMSEFFNMGNKYYNADRCMLNIIKTESFIFYTTGWSLLLVSHNLRKNWNFCLIFFFKNHHKGFKLSKIKVMQHKNIPKAFCQKFFKLQILKHSSKLLLFLQNQLCIEMLLNENWKFVGTCS